MNLVLKKTGRTELVRQLENCRVCLPREKSEVVIAFSNGRKGHVVKVEESERGIFLCVLDETMSPFLALSKLMGSKIHELDLDELIKELSARKEENVLIGWPSNDSHTVVGKVLTVGMKEKLIVSLFPVPEDIDEVNERVRQICSKKCKSAANGLQCGDCECCGNCEVLKEADDEIEKERNGK